MFADAARTLERFRPGETPVLALLYTLARRRFVDAARRQGRGGASTCPLELADTVPQVDHDELLAAALERALAQLPADLRTVAVMKLVQGCSFAEIAQQVGASEAACRKRFQRALEALRMQLTEDGYDGGGG